MTTYMRIRLTFQEATPEGEVVREESYGARLVDCITAEELAKFVSNTVLQNYPDFSK